MYIKKCSYVSGKSQTLEHLFCIYQCHKRQNRKDICTCACSHTQLQNSCAQSGINLRCGEADKSVWWRRVIWRSLTFSSKHQVFMYVILSLGQVCVRVCVIYGGQKAYLCWVQWRPELAGEHDHMLLITSKCLASWRGTIALRGKERQGVRLQTPPSLLWFFFFP